jgi:hypothetical protein
MASEAERMTSSNRPRRRRFKLFLWLPLLLVLIGVAYTFAWMHLAGVVRLRVEKTLAALRETGATADCADREVHGFPLHFTLHCKSIRYVDPASATIVSAASMRAVATIYDPRRIRIGVAAPAEVQMPGLGPIVVHWSRMEGELLPPLGREAAVEIRGEKLVAERTQSEPIFTVASMRGAASAVGEDADLKGHFEGLEFGSSLPDFEALPSLSGDADLVVAGGVADLASRDARSLRGRTVQIKKVTLSPGDDAVVTVKGRASVDDMGQLDADLRIRLRKPEELAAALKLAFPELTKEIDNAAAIVSVLGSDPLVPVTVRKGRVTVGFFPIGRIPLLP